MRTLLTRIATAAQYQFTLAIALVMLPVATVARRFGVTLPLHRALERSGDAYRNVR